MAVFRPLHRRAGRGAVLVIALMLISSALVRLAAGSGQAVAEAAPPQDQSRPGEHAAVAGDKTATTRAASKRLDRTQMGDLLTALRAREARVADREKRMELRARALAVAETEIARRMEALQQTEARLRKTLTLADGAAEGDLARLTAVYENMKPKDAAALFKAMEPDFAAGFLGRMRPDAAAAVMAGLPPENAYTISVILAGRNARAPKS